MRSVALTRMTVGRSVVNCNAPQKCHGIVTLVNVCVPNMYRYSDATRYTRTAVAVSVSMGKVLALYELFFIDKFTSYEQFSTSDTAGWCIDRYSVTICHYTLYVRENIRSSFGGRDRTILLQYRPPNKRLSRVYTRSTLIYVDRGPCRKFMDFRGFLVGG